MTFDSDPGGSRCVWLHTVGGWVVGLRPRNKPYPVLPSVSGSAEGIVRAVFEQTGLVVAAPPAATAQAGGDMVVDSDILAGSLRPSSAGRPELIHPSEFKCSPDGELVEAHIQDLEPPPLKVAAVGVRVEDVMIGDRTGLPIIGVRLEITGEGTQVEYCYDNLAQGTLGKDDELYGDEPTVPEEEDTRRGKRSGGRIGDATLGSAWAPARHLDGAGVQVYRLGGDMRGPST